MRLYDIMMVIRRSSGAFVLWAGSAEDGGNVMTDRVFLPSINSIPPGKNDRIVDEIVMK